MEIQFYPDDFDYVNATLRVKRLATGENDQSFLGLFCQACLRADGENYELLRPVLVELQKKHPAHPKWLAIEKAERGAV